MGTSFSPYAIGGAGLYRPNSDFAGGGSTQSENHFGWNVGGGVKIPLSGFKTFIEARYNRVNINGGSLSFVPLTFGVMF
jgi:opacity protein-like surface antigen